ncbi:hypothetical protein GCM10010415_29580 [Streptomyces atrovirens]
MADGCSEQADAADRTRESPVICGGPAGTAQVSPFTAGIKFRRSKERVRAASGEAVSPTTETAGTVIVLRARGTSGAKLRSDGRAVACVAGSRAAARCSE